MKSNQNMNIPTISVNMMIDKLGGLYASAINNGLPVKCIPGEESLRSQVEILIFPAAGQYTARFLSPIHVPSDLFHQPRA